MAGDSSKELLYLQSIMAVFEQIPPKQRVNKRGKRVGPSFTRQHRARHDAIGAMKQLIRTVDSIYVYTNEYYEQQLAVVKKNMIRGGIPRDVVTGIFALLG